MLWYSQTFGSDNRSPLGLSWLALYNNRGCSLSQFRSIGASKDLLEDLH